MSLPNFSSTLLSQLRELASDPATMAKLTALTRDPSMIAQLSKQLSDLSNPAQADGLSSASRRASWP